MSIQNTSNQASAPNEFTLQRIYATVSSEIPNIPEAFDISESPNLDVKLNIHHKPSTSTIGNYVIELTIVVMAMKANKTLFLVEVKQGGIFKIDGFDNTMLEKIINVHAPTLLYPYASALVSDLVLRGGFMPLHLPPVDFNAMHEQKNSEQNSE